MEAIRSEDEGSVAIVCGVGELLLKQEFRIIQRLDQLTQVQRRSEKMLLSLCADQRCSSEQAAATQEYQSLEPSVAAQATSNQTFVYSSKTEDFELKVGTKSFSHLELGSTDDASLSSDEDEHIIVDDQRPSFTRLVPSDTRSEHDKRPSNRGHSLAVAISNPRNHSQPHLHFKTTLIKRILSGMWMEVVMQVLVLVNGVTVIATSQPHLHDVCAEDGAVLFRAEVFFVMCFSIETMMKLMVFRRGFFLGPLAKWNVLHALVAGCCAGRLLCISHQISRIVCLGPSLHLVRLWKGWPTIDNRARFAADKLGIPEHRLCRSLFNIFNTSCIFMLSIVELLSHQLWDNPDPAVRRELKQYWESPLGVLFSLYMCVTGGTQWETAGKVLKDEDPTCYVMLVLFIFIFHFILVNDLLACFVQSAVMVTGKERQERLRNVDKYVAMLEGVFGRHTHSVIFDDFCSLLAQEDERILSYIHELGVTANDVEQLLYSLSGQATVDVDFEALTVGCIKMVDPSTKVDLLRLADTVEVVQARLESQPVAGSGSSLLQVSSALQILQTRSVAKKEFVRLLTGAHIFQNLHAEDECARFRKTVRAAIDSILHCDGGCGIVISLRSAFVAIQRQRVDFQVTDRCPKFPQGYMTERLTDVRVEDQAFAKAMEEFSTPTAKDRWPDDHPAAGLPKDGFTLLSHRGLRLKCAVKLVGLPPSPYVWDGVGTRHTTALGVMWALRVYPAVVLVRSDGGDVHGLFFNNGHVVALHCAMTFQEIT